MTDMALIPYADYKAAADQARTLRGTSAAIKSGELPGMLEAANTEVTTQTGLINELIGKANSLPEAGSGGGGEAYSEYDDVCFYDYDGTLVYSCTLAEANAMTSLPAVPDHSGDKVPLESRGWNYTLEEVNALKRKADIGAIYNPADGKTHFTLELAAWSGLTCTTQFYMFAGGTMHVDWGDGTVDTNTTSASYSAYLVHTYAEYGTYEVTIWCEGGNWTPYNQCLCNEAPQAIVGTFVLGTDVGMWWLGAFCKNMLSNTSVESIVWPDLYADGKDMSSTDAGTTNIASPRLKHFNVPRGVKQITLLSKGLPNLRRISIPESTVAAYDYFLAECVRMDRLCLPDGWINNYTGTAAQRFLLENYGGEEFTYRHSPNYRDLYLSRTLRKLTLAENVTSVNGGYWCQNCPLDDIYLYPDTPPTLGSTSNMWQKLRPNAKIHVKSSSLAAYKTATNWATWADYMVGDLE